jgi:hypothetical protein
VLLAIVCGILAASALSCSLPASVNKGPESKSNDRIAALLARISHKN